MKAKASSFADPADVVAFDKWYKVYRDRGMSHERAEKLAFAKGDNGMGCWGDKTAQTTTPMCALPPEDMVARFGSVAAAKHKRVRVTFGARSVSCLLADRMPAKRLITNGAGIDLNPAAAKALGLKPPFLREVEWDWEAEG